MPNAARSQHSDRYGDKDCPQLLTPSTRVLELLDAGALTYQAISAPSSGLNRHGCPTNPCLPKPSQTQNQSPSNAFRRKIELRRFNMSPSPPPSSRPSTGNSELEEIGLLLKLIHHRNKNQHRVQKWWKWLHALKRSVRDLLEIEEKRNASGGWLRREDEDHKQKLEKRVRDVVISSAWMFVPLYILSQLNFCSSSTSLPIRPVQ